VFTAFASPTSFRVAVHSLHARETRTLVDGTNPVVMQTGQLLFFRDGSLWSVPFDSGKLALTGSPVPVLEGVAVTTGGYATFSASNTGALAYRPGAAGSTFVVNWVGRDGVRAPLLEKPQVYQYPMLSPDGQHLAVVIGEPASQSDIWIYDIAERNSSRLTFGGRNSSPVWAPDGRHIFFAADSAEKIPTLYSISSDGMGQPEALIVSGRYEQRPCAVTPDGKTLLFTELKDGVVSIWTLPLDSSDRKPRQLLRGATFSATAPAISPNGRWIAYQSNEGGTNHVYVRSFPDAAGKCDLHRFECTSE
jgi:WD40 repeat protein